MTSHSRTGISQTQPSQLPGFPAIDPRISVALEAFATTLTTNFSTLVPAQPEDQLKGPMQTLLAAAGVAFGRTVVTRTEARVDELGGRPDLGVAVDGLLTGHLELKAPGKGARPDRFLGSDKVQWEKFKALPNLIYTDGSDWSLYRSGDLVQRVRLSGDVTTDGATAIGQDDAERLGRVVLDFFAWQPIVPNSPRALAELLAPLCRLLRQEVLAAMQVPGSALAELAHEWRTYLFPDADDAQFADAYAQTLTYALLLARFSGATDVEVSAAANVLDSGHGLLAQALRVLADPQARAEISLGIDLLRRAIEAIDMLMLTRKSADPWLYFYEDFLAAYDPKLRNDRGVYYTPVQVVRAQVNLVGELLQTRFAKPLTFADADVVLLDPAAGTGTYPLATIAHGLNQVRERFGEGAVGGRASEVARNTHAFEILVGPYSVAHLRLTQQLIDSGAALPADGVHVYLTDTLESPHAVSSFRATLLHRRLSEEHQRAQQVKANVRVLVCIGNPPYDRQQIDPDDSTTARKGGWVRRGDQAPGETPIFEDFLAPARSAGAGVHLKNLYNDYVYFWRWALWKVFDTSGGPGIVSFITASSYLRGPGFVGMRQVMRQTFDDLWIIDLEGDSLGARKTENVFAIRTPVAIAIGVRYSDPRSDAPAHVRYTRITGTREEKLAFLEGINSFADLDWQECFKGWTDPFLPENAENYFKWPLLTDLFPWQHSGVQMKRTWPIAETKELLERRWFDLLSRSGAERVSAFKETRDRKIYGRYSSLTSPGTVLTPLDQLPRRGQPLPATPYAYRSFDRQWLLPDPRLGDFMRPSLWNAHGSRQLYLTSLLTDVLGLGPAATASANLPDLHHFSGRGAKDVIPLWRDAAASHPNITKGLCDVLASCFGNPVDPVDVLAYCYSLLASPAYVERFSEELTIPGPRIPLTQDERLFDRAAGLGRILLWLHSYGQRFVPPGQALGVVPQGTALCTKGVPGTRDGYPESFSYDEHSRTLHVGTGEFAPVAPEIWNFSISGLQVVRSWLAYRMKKGAGRSSSPLDAIRPDRWTAQLTEELLELLWVLEATVALYPELATLLDEIVKSPTFSAGELPTPSPEERQPPATASVGQLVLPEE